MPKFLNNDEVQLFREFFEMHNGRFSKYTYGSEFDRVDINPFPEQIRAEGENVDLKTKLFSTYMVMIHALVKRVKFYFGHVNGKKI